MCKVTVSRMRERYAQTVLTFRITYIYGRKWSWPLLYHCSVTASVCKTVIVSDSYVRCLKNLKLFVAVQFHHLWMSVCFLYTQQLGQMMPVLFLKAEDQYLFRYFISNWSLAAWEFRYQVWWEFYFEGCRCWDSFLIWNSTFLCQVTFLISLLCYRMSYTKSVTKMVALNSFRMSVGSSYLKYGPWKKKLIHLRQGRPEFYTYPAV